MYRTVIRLVVLFLLGTGSLLGQDPVWYDVDLSNAAHHEARITVTFPDLATAGTLELRMSRTSPGRYALHEFGKNVYDLQVVDGMGRNLEVRRPDAYQWDIEHPAGDVKVSYTLFADLADGTYSGIDRTQAHLNIPATFMWARGLEDRPIRVDFRPPDGARWQVATQLPQGSGDFSFTAPDLAYFLDSPTHLGQIEFREWRANDSNRSRFRVAVDHDGTDAEVDDFAAKVRTIVEAERQIYGAYPAFDFGTYTFVAAYRPWIGGDGMEHRNSTSLTSSTSLGTNEMGLLGTVAHEFFHAWNVERIRPASLEPFDFERTNMSRELWFAEGFTSYYTHLVLRRAGLIDDDQFASRIGNAISTVTNSPARRYRSPIEMSMHAPFVDEAVSVDPNNHGNTFLSYYTWGSTIGLGLDLALRKSFPSARLSTDALMRALWQSHGVSETPYTVEDLEAALASLTGDADWAQQFFDDYVRGRAIPDYEALLANAGMVLRPRNPDGPWVGQVQLQDDARGILVTSYTLVGSPLYEAGIDEGDRITSVDGASVTAANQFQEIWQGKSPGDEMEIEFWSRGQTLTTTLTLAADPQLEVVTLESQGDSPSAEARAFRRQWLNGR